MKRYTFKMSSGGAILVTSGVVVLALIGAGQVIRWIVNGIAHALVVRGGWAAAEAAKAAPVVWCCPCGRCARTASTTGAAASGNMT